MSRLALGLVHHPVLDRDGGVVTTAMTNLDLHDMSRSALTYGAEALYVIHPIPAQRELAERIREHWVTGSGRRRIPDRGTALEVLRIVPSLEETYEALGGRSSIEVWTTAASARAGTPTSYGDARARLETSTRPVLLLFGTGWGLAPEVITSADVRLEPIQSREGLLRAESADESSSAVADKASGYNHLSVRAACAISLDRLRG